MLFVASKCSIKLSIILKTTGFSLPLIVLMMNLSSFEKKKKLPDLPAPWPDLKIMCKFFSILNDFLKSIGLISSKI